MTLPQLATIEEVAPLLHLEPDTVMRMCRAKRLPAVKVGRRWLIHLGRLADQLDPMSAPAPSSAGSAAGAPGRGVSEAGQ